MSSIILPRRKISRDEAIARAREAMAAAVADIRRLEGQQAKLEGLKAKLVEGLNEGIALMRAEPTDDTPNSQRAGAARQIWAVCEFLRGFGVDVGVIGPLQVTMAAFSEADRGVDSPMLQASKPKRHGARLTMRSALCLAAAVKAVNVRIKAGHTRAQALRYIAGRLRALGWKGKNVEKDDDIGVDKLAAVLKTFRKNLSVERGRPSNEAGRNTRPIAQAQRAYDDWERVIERLPPDEAVDVLCTAIKGLIQRSP